MTLATARIATMDLTDEQRCRLRYEIERQSAMREQYMQAQEWGLWHAPRIPAHRRSA